MTASMRTRGHVLALSSRPVRLAIAVVTILSLLPVSWAAAFPEPKDRRLCPPHRETPPTLPPDYEIQAPSPAGAPVVRLLNPIRGTAPQKVSDKFDGTDARYHMTAVAAGVPADAVVEAFVVRGFQAQVTILGTLCPVPGTRDTFEGFWDIPDSFAEGTVDLGVQVFDRAGDGAQVLATDRVSVDISHLPGGSPASEDVRLLWPVNDGPLGFFRNKAGEWKMSIRAITGSTTAPSVMYSTTPVGGQPSFRDCAAAPTAHDNKTPNRTFDLTCRLQAGDRPSAVTAVAAIAPSSGSSDAHRVRPFLQRPGDMSVTVSGLKIGGGTQTPLATPNYPSSRRRGAGEGCLQFRATVRDQFGRPVPGANVDAELRGPAEDASFADLGPDASAPDRAVVTEPTVACGTGTPNTGRQGRVTVADGPDAKMIESVNGTGDQGEWTFFIRSEEPGFSKLRVWVDEEPLGSETAERSPDDDQLGEDEAVGFSEGQWLEGTMTLDISPRDVAAEVGSCRVFRIQALAGNSEVSDFNIDMHIRTPDPELKLCDDADDVLSPADDPVSHPKGHVHPPDETGTTPEICPTSGSGRCHHFEGNTNAQGELVFGLSSEVAGKMTLEIWADGEVGDDTEDDVRPTNATNRLDFSLNWVSDVVASPVKLLAPSDQTGTALPNGMDNGLQKVSSDSFKIIARAALPHLVEKVTIEVAPSSGSGVVLGEATRLGHSNYYSLTWNLTRPLSAYANPGGQASPSPSPSSSPTLPGANVKPGVPDGTYTITVNADDVRADSHPIEVNRSSNPPGDQTAPWEWARLTSPKDGAPLGFDGGSTDLSGEASPGSDGIYLYYTTAGLSEKPAWKFCGYGPLHTSTTAGRTAPHTFTRPCALTGTDKAERVTGVAAVPFNCDNETPITPATPTECAHPSPPPVPVGGVTTVPPSPRSGKFGAGDTVAVRGCAGAPCMVLGPTDWYANQGTCVGFSIQVAQKNLPLRDQRVVVEFEGPTDNIRFCDPNGEKDDAWLASPETVSVDPYGTDLHQIAGFTDKLGEFRFGVRSDDSSFLSIFSAAETGKSTVTAWLDDGDLIQEDGEQTKSAPVHWWLPGRCTVIATNRSDIVSGTVRSDKICGLLGDDEVFAQEGKDIVLGGGGNDIIYGDEGDDSLYGEDGDDKLVGGPGKDTLEGGAGNDILVGGPGNDKLDGGEGVDVCKPGAGKADEVVNCEEIILPKKKRRAPRAI